MDVLGVALRSRYLPIGPTKHYTSVIVGSSRILSIDSQAILLHAYVGVGQFTPRLRPSNGPRLHSDDAVGSSRGVSHYLVIKTCPGGPAPRHTPPRAL